ncbi:MAG: caspase family protein [Acidiferrobacterales bacterium]|nr:caspase family protein [Acidiferrobacterales bacterium]
MNKRIIYSVALTIAMIASATTGIAAASDKIALIVGNSAYSAVTPLDNPVPDAELISSKLESLGFEVTLLKDSSLNDLRAGISAFGKKLRAGGKETTGLFYFAGHGVQSFGNNYLLPVDTELEDAADLDLVALEAGSILRQMFSAKNKTNIVILDACRNNPFDHIPEFGDNGLAEMKAPTGTYLAYATSPGNVALDGSGANSPFTSALANAMSTPGLPIEQVFKQVRVSVLEQTNGMQTPWDTSSLTNQFYFNEPIVLSEEELVEKGLWESAKLSDDMLQVMLFLRNYPEGSYSDEARLLLAEKVAELQKEPQDGTVAQRTASETESASAASSTQSDQSAASIPSQPDQSEQALIDKAQSSGALEDYQAYADAYPNGVYIELAKTEIVSMLEKLQPQQVEDPDAKDKPEIEVAAIEPTSTSATPSAAEAIRFDTPISSGEDVIRGLSLAELIKGKPLHSPIEGLPEAAWKEQSCSGCHQWNKDALCAQAKVYTTPKGETALAKKHPYGGGFKQSMRIWAAGGCS